MSHYPAATIQPRGPRCAALRAEEAWHAKLCGRGEGGAAGRATSAFLLVIVVIVIGTEDGERCPLDLAGVARGRRRLGGCVLPRGRAGARAGQRSLGHLAAGELFGRGREWVSPGRCTQLGARRLGLPWTRATRPRGHPSMPASVRTLLKRATGRNRMLSSSARICLPEVMRSPTPTRMPAVCSRVPHSPRPSGDPNGFRKKPPPPPPPPPPRPLPLSPPSFPPPEASHSASCACGAGIRERHTRGRTRGGGESDARSGWLGGVRRGVSRAGVSDRDIALLASARPPAGD